MPIIEPKSINISVKAAASTITGIVTLLGAVWALDNHYASAADVEKMQRNFTDQVSQLRQDQLEDELFKLDVKKQSVGGKLNPVDQALYDRYSRKLMQNRTERGIVQDQIHREGSSK